MLVHVIINSIERSKNCGLIQFHPSFTNTLIALPHYPINREILISHSSKKSKRTCFSAGKSRDKFTLLDNANNRYIADDMKS